MASGKHKFVIFLLFIFFIPFLSLIKIIFAPLDKTSSTLLIVFSIKLSDGAITITGTPFSIRAIGPCFISPAGYPSACK